MVVDGEIRYHGIPLPHYDGYIFTFPSENFLIYYNYDPGISKETYDRFTRVFEKIAEKMQDEYGEPLFTVASRITSGGSEKYHYFGLPEFKRFGETSSNYAGLVYMGKRGHIVRLEWLNPDRAEIVGRTTVFQRNGSVLKIIGLKNIHLDLIDDLEILNGKKKHIVHVEEIQLSSEGPERPKQIGEVFSKHISYPSRLFQVYPSFILYRNTVMWREYYVTSTTPYNVYLECLKFYDFDIRTFFFYDVYPLGMTEVSKTLISKIFSAKTRKKIVQRIMETSLYRNLAFETGVDLDISRIYSFRLYSTPFFREKQEQLPLLHPFSPCCEVTAKQIGLEIFTEYRWYNQGIIEKMRKYFPILSDDTLLGLRDVFGRIVYGALSFDDLYGLFIKSKPYLTMWVLKNIRINKYLADTKQKITVSK